MGSHSCLIAPGRLLTQTRADVEKVARQLDWLRSGTSTLSLRELSTSALDQLASEESPLMRDHSSCVARRRDTRSD